MTFILTTLMGVPSKLTLAKTKLIYGFMTATMEEKVRGYAPLKQSLALTYQNLTTRRTNVASELNTSTAIFRHYKANEVLTEHDHAVLRSIFIWATMNAGENKYSVYVRTAIEDEDVANCPLCQYVRPIQSYGTFSCKKCPAYQRWGGAGTKGTGYEVEFCEDSGSPYHTYVYEEGGALIDIEKTKKGVVNVLRAIPLDNPNWKLLPTGHITLDEVDDTLILGQETKETKRLQAMGETFRIAYGDVEAFRDRLNKCEETPLSKEAIVKVLKTMTSL